MGGDFVYSYALTGLKVLLGTPDRMTDNPPGAAWRCRLDHQSLELVLRGHDPRCPTLELRGPEVAKGRLAHFVFLEMPDREKMDWVISTLKADQLCPTRLST